MKICAWCFKFTVLSPEDTVGISICHRCQFKLTHPPSEWPKEWWRPPRRDPEKGKENNNGKKDHH